MKHETAPSSTHRHHGGPSHRSVHRGRRLDSSGGGRRWRRTVGTALVAVVAVGTFVIGTGGVASAAAPTAVPQASDTSGIKCLGWLGWGFVEVGATAASTGWWEFTVGSISTGMTIKEINSNCSWRSASEHIGYQKLCWESKFMYVSPISGKAVFDNRYPGGNGPCANSPYIADRVLCEYIKPAGYENACVWQAIRNLVMQNTSAPYYWGSPFDWAAGGGGGGSW